MGFLQKTYWYSRAQSGNFWRFNVIIIDTLLWYKIWQLSGYNPTRAKQNFSGDGKEFEKVSRAVGKAESRLH